LFLTLVHRFFVRLYSLRVAHHPLALLPYLLLSTFEKHKNKRADEAKLPRDVFIESLQAASAAAAVLPRIEECGLPAEEGSHLS